MIEKFKREAARLQSLHELVGDELTSYNMAFGNGTQATDFARRCLYRTIFSMIESDISLLKSSALLFTFDQPGFFSESEILALKDQEYSISDKGKIDIKKARINLKANLRLAFRLFGRCQDKEFEIDYNTPGGNAFTQAIDIRNRMTHPKDPNDWKVNESEASLVLDAWNWFCEQLNEVCRSNSWQDAQSSVDRFG